jgi:hypothetical protein
MLLLEDFHKLAHGQMTLVDCDLIVNCEAFWDSFHGATHDWVIVLRFGQLHLLRLFDQEERKGQVDEGILELFKVGKALNELVEFSSDSTSDHGGGSGNSRDNFTSDHLSLSVVTLGDLVVTGAQLGSSVDVINVEVAIVVLFEFGCLQVFLLDINDHSFKLTHQRLEIRLVVRGADGSKCWWGQFLLFTSLSLFWGLNNDCLLDVRISLMGDSDLFYLLNVCYLLDAQVESDQVGTRHNEAKMILIVSVELSIAGASLGARPEGLTM